MSRLLLSFLPLALLWCQSTEAGTLGLQIAGSDARYEGPDSPTTDQFAYDVMVALNGQATVALLTDAPSGNQTFTLDPSIMNEVDRALWSDGETQLGLISTSLDLSQVAIDDGNIDQIERLELTWWDPQFDDGFLTTSLEIAGAPSVITVPEPSILLLLIPVALLAVCRRGGRFAMASMLVLVAIAPVARADGEHSHPEIHTPLGFKLTTERQRDGLSFVVRENGHVIVFAPDNVWFDENAGPMGSSIAWRWQEPLSGPFQSGDCLYVSPNGNSVCDSDLYALEDGIFDHPWLPALSRGFNHVELPGHITDLTTLADASRFASNLWIGGTTKSLKRTPNGVTITADEAFNVGSGPWLILEGVAIPEPSAWLLTVVAAMAMIGIGYRPVKC